MIMGILGGYVIAVYFFGMSPTAYFDPMPLHISMFDLLTGIVKSFVFGGIIMTISCYKGMKTTGGAAGVGRATTNSVVLAYCCILFTNFFLTLALNIFRSQLQKIL
jgi:phospholipid/cholesterol/gamma-HCH transport system permease protein